MVSLRYILTLPGNDFRRATDLIEQLHEKAKTLPFRKVSDIDRKPPNESPVEVSPGWPARIEHGISFKVWADRPATFGLASFEDEIGYCHWWDAVQTARPSLYGDLLDYAADLGIEVVQSLDGFELRSRQTPNGIVWITGLPE